MKIAVFTRRQDLPGGAEESMEALKQHLEQEHEVQLFSLIDEEASGSKAFHLPLPRQLKILAGFREGLSRKEELEAFDPDLILAQHELAYLGAKYVEENDADMIYFLHDYENVYDERFYGRYLPDSIANYFTSFITEKMTGKIIEASEKIVANSDYVAKRYEEFYGIDTETVYPFVDTTQYETEREDAESILHVNPLEEKGILRTLEIAEKMPEKKFTVLGTPKKKRIAAKIHEAENVENIEYVENMKEIYSRTKIALMPSKWEEPFGRIPVEAGASGIPTIATRKGGLPESVGIEELTVEDSTQAFIDKIEEVEASYEEYSEKARENAEEKRMEKQAGKIENILNKVFEKV